MRFSALNVNQETNAAGIVFELRVVKALLARGDGSRRGATGPSVHTHSFREGDVITFHATFELKFLYSLRKRPLDAIIHFRQKATGKRLGRRGHFQAPPGTFLDFAQKESGRGK